MTHKYRFQIENGRLYDGDTEIIIRDHIAEIETLTPAISLVIAAHGGLLETDEPVSGTAKKRKTKKTEEGG